jgi:hypothetical protein
MAIILRPRERRKPVAHTIASLTRKVGAARLPGKVSDSR